MNTEVPQVEAVRFSAQKKYRLNNKPTIARINASYYQRNKEALKEKRRARYHTARSNSSS